MSKQSDKALSNEPSQKKKCHKIILEPGEVLTDWLGKDWKLGNMIGEGGFGKVFLTSNLVNEEVKQNTPYVVKVESLLSQALVDETFCLLDIGETFKIDKWRKQKQLNHVGMLAYISSGINYVKQIRFLVLPRYQRDLQSVFVTKKHGFDLKTVLNISLQIMDVLEYIHTQGYVHRDVKASNIVFSSEMDPQTKKIVYKLYLVDFGLAAKCETSDGNHKGYYAHDHKINVGTTMFSSLDSHLGVISRRSDIESLGYNIIYWLTSKLPWAKYVKSPDSVLVRKQAFHDNIKKSLELCLENYLPFLDKFFQHLKSISYKTCPNHVYLKKLFNEALIQHGCAANEFDFKDEGGRKRRLKKDNPKEPTEQRTTNNSKKNKTEQLKCIYKNENHNMKQKSKYNRLASKNVKNPRTLKPNFSSRKQLTQIREEENGNRIWEQREPKK